MRETLRLPGLRRPVRLVRDGLGVAHLFAEERLDVYRGLGFVMARDRLWQMDLYRRLGLGRMAEVLGRPFLALDVAVRTLGLPDAAARAAAGTDGDPAAVIEAFAAGVNAHLAAGAPGPEFALLGYAPEPWGPIDSAAIEFFVGLSLSLESLEPKLLLARALGHLGPERGEWLFPGALPGAAREPERLAAYRDLETGLLAALAPPRAGGSNAWAVAPRRSAGGSTLVAGDPHLLLTAPGPWYLVHLVAPGLDVAGAAYAGGPLVQVGRNRRGAWSVTNLTSDDSDLVLERLHPDGARYALGPEVWEHLRAREETVAVRGEEPYRLVVRETRHGPLLDPIAAAAGALAGCPVALRWKGVVAPGVSLAGWLAVNASRGLDDVLAAAPLFDGAPFQMNLIYGDVGGRLAHVPIGGAPRRAGMLPALGWHGEVTWDGIGSLGRTPWRVDPPEGAVWTANERTGAADRAAGGDGQPYGESPYRARRIREVLLAGEAHSVESFAALQTDDLDLAATANLPPLCDALAGWRPEDQVATRARDLLLAWDGRTGAESAAAAFYSVLFYAEWIPTLFPDEVCPGLARHWRVATWGAEAVLRAPRSPWFADAGAKGEALRACAARAVERLRALVGDDPRAWRWGELHRLRLDHPLAAFPRFAAGRLGDIPLGGSPFTVHQQRFAAPAPPFGALVGPGLRMVADLGDPDHLHVTLATGQAGDPESPHFADQLPRWRAGRLARLALAPAALTGVETVLEP